MATLIRADVVVHLPVAAYEAQVVAANRRLIEEGLVRRDYAHLPDGKERFLRVVRQMELRGGLRS